jgi:hypothetical protein
MTIIQKQLFISRKEVIDIATENVVALGHKQSGGNFICWLVWFVLFKSRWPEQIQEALN